MKIKMKATAKGSHNGCDIHTYHKGKVYEVGGEHPMSEDLANTFLEAELAVEHDGDETEDEQDESEGESETEETEDEDEQPSNRRRRR